MGTRDRWSVELCRNTDGESATTQTKSAVSQTVFAELQTGYLVADIKKGVKLVAIFSKDRGLSDP